MRNLVVLIVAAACALTAMAVPANPKPGTAVQPDGTTVTLRLVGDEYYHFTTTLDGYTVERDETTGGYYYVERDGERLRATGVLAHDAGRRSAAEQALLATLPQRLTDRAVKRESDNLRRQVRAAQQRRATSRFDYSKFRGLIVLVEFSDRSFTRSDAQSFYTHMANDHDYTGYTNEDGSAAYMGTFTGSVRDYYYDNSMGQFDAKFDVVGPVKLNNYVSTQGNYNSISIFRAALNALDSTVDFSQYDTDGDGYVDMVYFLVAGMGSNVQGHDSRLLWPYMSRNLWRNVRKDGKAFDLYACSTEVIEEIDDHVLLEGIGTFCHEFTHVLGLPDLYDTDYEDQGQSHDPGEWDIMSGGSYLNEGRTPCGYSLYERYALGFADVPVLDTAGDYTLAPLGTSNQGYRLLTPVQDEIFLLENRQKTTKWDAYLPGHGMLIARMDSTNVSAWTGNNVNDNPAHNYYELLRAGGGTSGDLPGDPFPGTSNVTFINNHTTANLRTWNGQYNPFVIMGIGEDGGDIHFTLVKEGDVVAEVEDFEEMAVSTGNSVTGVEGRFATWNFTKSNVQAPGEGKCDGEHAVGMISPSLMVMTSDVSKKVYMVSAQVYNAASEAKFKLYYSVDQGTTWKEVPNATQSVAANTNGTVSWNVDFNQPVRFRLNMTSGTKSTSNRAYVDNFTLYHNGDLDPETPAGDVNGDGSVNATDVAIVINIIAGLESVADYPAADVTGDGVVNASDVAAIINIIAGIE